ncbi:nicotinate-nucleotide adenylyltransferase [Clostridium tertium]|jgi:nicotinate-nucleotide adenylyltransferase|uniref:Probable nicotinate-nucleotide adenylyltransferase n=1 Tax=Clostridium tertium TaxID=1559 RepID=A0A9X3XK05_9CLOT|nr:MULTISPECIES: nicotinate-nucleotide adenylyltransferase [Clostridium]MBU6136735.1 nicotinate-nucleotide adenylyltransferase [Clostridium tertium]MDB1921502.1 nicotinate-nucleotide adenylyltransferase [Clostridium tertium]MDB1924746.1 nicotinate-nucleotide adenylyltransferase [Clostridium tertium]MDB1928274.1 nicotinate-nucleotide adenylyltransferase [Clostridium tertium]MDB1939531.1 nicotinate-nucleotide adenylyltransferase [Clostridium tertium]
MKKIGIIGGTFNPIHLAHLYIAYEAKCQLNLDKVIFMPAGSPPHKKNEDILEAPLRYKMVLEAIKKYEDFEISNYEIEKEGFSYTYETLENFKSKDNILYFITGADCLINIEKWKNPDRIFKASKLVVFNRPGYDKESLKLQKNEIEKKYNTSINFLDIMDLEISSTMIRDRIKDGKKIDFFIPKEVLDFIRKNNIYNYCKNIKE